jgi:hypothetical protein
MAYQRQGIHVYGRWTYKKSAWRVDRGLGMQLLTFDEDLEEDGSPTCDRGIIRARLVRHEGL